MHIFDSVDLSSNKLSGTLLETYQVPSSSLNLSINLLSGEIPSRLRVSRASLNVLEGNIFGCPILHNDINSKETACGSTNLEYPFIAWLVMSVAVLIAFICVYCSRTIIAVRMQQHVLEWWGTARQQRGSKELYQTMATITFLESTCSMVIIISVLFVLGVMMSYICMKSQSGSHSNSLYQVQYMYTTTVAYTTGKTPTVLTWMFVTLSGLVVTVLCVSRRPLKTNKDLHQAKRIDNNDASDGVDIYQNYEDGIKSIVVLFVVEVIVSAIAIGVNIGFVRIYFSKPSNLTAVNLAFAIIKSLVSAIVVPFSSKLVPKSSQQSHAVLMSVMVNVIGPGLAVLISSPLCLFDFIHKQSVSASYQYPTYQYASLANSTLYSATSTITPEWFYSYQCSSSFLTSYLPNFVYMYIISGILSPLFNLVAMILLSSGIAAKYTTTKQRQSLFGYLNYVLQLIDDKLRVGKIFYIDSKAPLDVIPVFASLSSLTLSSSLPSSPPPTVEMSIRNSTLDTSRIIDTSSNNGSDYDINVREMMPSLCVDITMLLTFGLASPLFAVIVSCSIIINTLLLRLALGRYISVVSKAVGSDGCYEKLERAFESEWRCLPRMWWMISVFVGLFWSLFVNDMVGEYDPTGGIVAAVLMTVWCPFVFISLQWLLLVNPDSDNDPTSSCKVMLDCIRDHADKVSSYVHVMIWKHLLRLDSNSSISSIVGTDDMSSVSTKITEVISPLSLADQVSRPLALRIKG